MMNLIKLTLLLLILTLSLLTQANEVMADDDLAQEKVMLTVAIESIDYFPFNYHKDGQIKGFSVEILDYIEANSKYEFEFIILPWPRALTLVAHGKVDLILTLFRNPQRESIYHYIEPSYANEVNQLFTLAENNYQFDGNLQSLTPYSIGTKRAYSYGESFDEANYLNKFPVLTEDVLLKLLLAKKIDLMIGNPFNFIEIMRKNKVLSQVKAIKPYIAITPVYMGLTREREDALDIKKTFEKLTIKLKASSHYQTLLNQYHLNF